MEKEIICLACINTFNIKDYNNYICPHCGYQIRARRYERILNYASDAVQFGYNYRIAYEEQLEREKEINMHYYLPSLGQAADFIALAVLNAIIGGLSYDAIKQLVKAVKNKLLKQGKDLSIYDFIDDEEKFKVFAAYIEAFHNNFEGLHPEVKEAIYEEMIVHRSSEQMEKVMKFTNPQLSILMRQQLPDVSQEHIFKFIIDAKNELAESSKIRNELFKDTFKNIGA